jgi:hypothetical protein
MFATYFRNILKYQTLWKSVEIFLNPSNIKYHKNPSNGSRVLWWEQMVTQMDGWTHEEGSNSPFEILRKRLKKDICCFGKKKRFIFIQQRGMPYIKMAERIIQAVLHVTGHYGTQLHCVVFYLRRATISFVMSVRLSVPNNTAPNGSAFITFSLQSENNESYFTRTSIHLFDHFSLSSSYNKKCCRKKVIEKLKTHILCSVTFFRKSRRLWDNFEKCCRAGQAKDGNMAQVQCMPGRIRKGKHTHTHIV